MEVWASDSHDIIELPLVDESLALTVLMYRYCELRRLRLKDSFP
jgi:hypothetical protein